MRPVLDNSPPNVRSQDLPKVVTLNGAFYLISPGDLRAARSFFPAGTVPLVMTDPIEGLDIDTDLDWAFAEAAVSIRELRPQT